MTLPTSIVRRPVIVSAFLAMAGVGCQATTAPAPEDAHSGAQDAPPRSAKAHGGQDRTLHMQVHFWAAIDARDALIGADSEAARRSLAWLAEHQQPHDVPAAWKPFLAPMRRAAADAARAGTVEGVATGIALVGQRCGECHVRMGTEIAPAEEIDQGIAPEGPELMEDRMGRHAWSVDELWAGLVYPSEAAWQHGVEVLAQMPTEAPVGAEPAPPDSPTASPGDQLEGVRAIGREAAAANSLDQRTAVFARLLLSCEGCHGGG